MTILSAQPAKCFLAGRSRPENVAQFLREKRLPIVAPVRPCVQGIEVSDWIVRETLVLHCPAAETFDSRQVVIE